MIEQFDSRLQGFFDEMVDALIPERRTDDNNIIANLFFYKIPLIVDHAKLMTHLFEN